MSLAQLRKDNPQFAGYSDDALIGMVANQTGKSIHEVTSILTAGSNNEPAKLSPLQQVRADNPSYSQYSDDALVGLISQQTGKSIQELQPILFPESEKRISEEGRPLLKRIGDAGKEFAQNQLGVDMGIDTSDQPTGQDFYKGFGAGANKLVSGIGYLAELAGADETGKAIREFGDRGAAYWNERMSEGGKKAASTQVFEDDPDSLTGLRLSDDWGNALLMGAAQSAPSMFAAAIPGAAATGTIQKLASLGLAGGSGATIPLLAGTAAPVGVTSNIIARAPAAIGFGGAEGVVAGAMNAADFKSNVEEMPIDELRKSPVFQALEVQHGEDQARQIIAEQAAIDVFGRTAISTGAIGAATGGGALGQAYQKIKGAASGGILNQMAKGAGQEFIQETPQSGGEKLIENIATKDYLDPNKDITEGVLAEAASGGAIGGLMGGVVGAGGAVNVTQSKAGRINAERQKLDLQKITSAQSVDEAIDAAAESVSQKPVTTQDIFDDAEARNDLLRKAELINQQNGGLDGQIQETGTETTETNVLSGQNVQESPEVVPNGIVAQSNAISGVSQAGQENKRSQSDTVAQNLSNAPKGNKSEVVLPDGTSLPAEWMVVDADSIKATLKNGKNQPRDRSRVSSDIQIQQIANNPDYRRLSDSPVMDVGAPTIDSSGSIVGGNGRFEALSKAYDQGTANQYLSTLTNDAINKGIDPASFAGMKKPVLVRRISQPFDTQKLAVASNSGSSLEYSALERARIDAGRIKNIDSIEVSDNGDIALTQQNITNIRNSLADYNSSELAAFEGKDGAVSQEGLRRLKNAILFSAYGDSPTLSRMVESTDGDMRNIVGALTKVAGDVSKVRANVESKAIPRELDITENLIEAVEKISQLRTNGMSVEQFMAQDSMFADIDVDQASRDIMSVLSESMRSQKKMVEFLRDVYDSISRINTTTDSIFGDNKLPTKKEVIENARKNTKQAAKQQSESKPDQETDTENEPKSATKSGDETGGGQGEAKYSRSPTERLKDRERANRLQKLLRQAGHEFTITAQDMRDFAVLGSGTVQEAEAAERIAKIFGRRIVPIKADGKFRINGVIIPSIKDTIFIDVRTDKATHAVVGHELSHHLENDAPKVYREMVDALNNIIQNEQGYREKYQLPENETSENVIKEIVGDIVGDNFTDPKFWDKVAAHNPNAFRRIADSIITWLKRLITNAKLRRLGSEQWVTDAQKAQDIVAKAVAKYTHAESSLDVIKNKVMFQKAEINESKSFEEYGNTFKTGKKVTFYYLHNKESATDLFGKPKKGDQFRRDKEPSGRYLVHVSKETYPDYGDFDTGEITFNNPLVIDNDNLDWKNKLSAAYSDKTGKKLSQALIDAGYDGVVTVDYSSKGVPHTSEILDLTTFDYNKAKFSFAGEKSETADKYSLTTAQQRIDAGDDVETVRRDTGWFKGVDGKWRYEISDVVYNGKVMNNAPQPENAKIDENKNLYVAHNLSAENIRHADEIGGLAAPSLAIAKAGNSFSGFGEITLIAKPDILKSGKVRTFDADVYTPRHPRVVHEINSKRYDAFINTLGNTNGLDTPSIDDLQGSDGIEAITRSPAVQYYFLKSKQKQPAIRPKKIDSVTKKVVDIMKVNSLSKEWQAEQNDDVMKVITDYANKKIDDFNERRTGEVDEVGRNNLFRSYKNNILLAASRYIKSGGKDLSRLKNDVTDKIARNKTLENEFKLYALSKFNSLVDGKKIFKGFSPAGKRKYIPYNMDTIIKEMTRQLKAGEDFFYGAGNIRSAFAKEFKSIKEIQKDRDRLVSPDEMDRIKDESQAKVADAIEELKPYYKYEKDSINYYSDSAQAIAEGPRGWNEAFNMDADAEKIIKGVIDYLRHLPTEYFEAKAQRPVSFNEFESAVIPKGTPKDVIDILKNNGLRIQYYTRNNEESRAQSVAKAANKDKALFSRADSIPETINVDGKDRPTRNSEGKLIHPTEEGIKNFWKWFGDSEVVDKSGKPVIVYHGASSNFNEFNSEYLGSSSLHDNSKIGFFFTENKEVAEMFGDNVSEFYLSIKNPITLTSTEFYDDFLKPTGDLTQEQIDDIVNDIENEGYYVSIGIGDEVDLRDMETGKYINDINDIPEHVREMVNKIESSHTGDFREPDINTKELIEKYHRGNDGIEVKANDNNLLIQWEELIAKQWIAFKPNQIKSADNNTGQFSTESNDIRFSRKEVNESEQIPDTSKDSDDIRFSRASGNSKVNKYLSDYKGIYSELLSDDFIKNNDFDAWASLRDKAVGIRNAISDMLDNGDINGLGVDGDALLSRNPNGSKNAWRITYFDDNGNPNGHSEYVDAKNAVSDFLNPSRSNKVIALFSRSDTLSQAGVNTEESAKPSDLPEETKLQAFRRRSQDAMLRFKVAQNWLKEQGVNLSEAANVYQRENISKGKTANRIEDFRREQLEPLIKRIAETSKKATGEGKFDLADIATYLEAVHIPEANERMRTIHKDDKATANGITDKQARDVIKQFESMPNFAEFKKLADDVRKIGVETLDMRLEAGLISQDQYDAYKSTYKNWVPLRGNVSTQAFGKGLSTNPKDKRRMGHGFRENEFVIENLVQDRERAIMQIEKNKVGMSVATFLMEAENENIGTVGKPEKMRVMKDFSYAVKFKGGTVGSFETEAGAKNAINRIMSKKGDMALEGESFTEADFNIEKSYDPHIVMMARPQLAENEIQVYVNGHAIRLQLNDPLLARAATNAGIEQVGAIAHGARMFNRFLSKAYTAWSPDFLFMNMARDAYSGTLVLTGKKGAAFAAKTFTNYGTAIKELIKGRKDPSKSEWVTRYRNAGGNIGAAYLSDLDRIGTDAVAALQEFAGARETYRMVYNEQISKGASAKKARTMAALKAGVAKTKALPVVGKMFDTLERINMVIENALRLATFKTAIEAGESDQQAAMLSKDLMNFNRKGEVANQMGALYLFYNPGMQGAHIVGEALFTSKHKAQVWSLLGALTTISFMLAELGRGGDDDDEREWENTPEYIKDRNMIINVGDKQITIPVAYGFGIFHAMGNYLSDLNHGADSNEIAVKLASGMFENFSVFGNPIHETDEGTQIRPDQLVPTIFKMIFAPGLNLDGLGRQIQPEKRPWNESMPDSQNMFRSVRGTLYEDIASFMNDNTGGSKYNPGAIDVSPNTIKYWVTSLTGGAGRFVSDITTGAMDAASGVAPELVNVPVLRKFMREPGVTDSRAGFWKAAKEAQNAAERFNRAVKDGDVFRSQKMLDQNQEIIALAKYSKDASKAASMARNLIHDIQANKDMSKAEKRLRIREIEVKEQRIYDEFLRAFQKTKKTTK